MSPSHTKLWVSSIHKFIHVRSFVRIMFSDQIFTEKWDLSKFKGMEWFQVGLVLQVPDASGVCTVRLYLNAYLQVCLLNVLRVLNNFFFFF